MSEITPEQLKAARSLRGWSQAKLAAMADVGVSTIADYERGARKTNPEKIAAMKEALERKGVLFIHGGVQRKWGFDNFS